MRRALVLAALLASACGRVAFAADSPIVSAVVGGVATMSGDAGTDVTPTMSIDVESCFAVGKRCPVDFYGRIGISSAPGASVNLGDPKTFKSAEVGFGVAYKVGDAGGVVTSLVAEGGFLSRLPDTPDPQQKVIHYLVVGGRIRAKSNGNSLTVGLGRDQLADVPGPDPSLDKKGLQVVLYGSLDVPSTNGVVTILGDATVNAIVPDGSQKRDVVRVGVGIDVARMISAGRAQLPASGPDKMVPAEPSVTDLRFGPVR